MILNGYAVLDAFLSLLRLGLALLILWGGSTAWWAWRRHADAPEDRKALEDRCYLLFLAAGLLLWLNVLAWSIFYLLLQSYVPEWPGVMCIYGVTRIGAGSLGASRTLPLLVAALQAMKPALVFLSGGWFVLYLLNRRTRTAPLTGRVLLVLLAAGLLAAADAAAELAYLGIPKKEEFLSTGCCTVAFDADSGASRFLPGGLAGEEEARWLPGVAAAVNAILLLALFGCTRRGRRPRARWLAGLLLGAVLATAVNAVFLVEVAAPHLLHKPYHHCPYDLVPQAPESLVAVALFLGGSFSIGWACVARWLGKTPETVAFLPGMVDRLLHVAFLGTLWSVGMMLVELALT